MEPIITIVGFLGVGKTTLMKKLTNEYLDNSWNPYILLNDYENASLDAQDFLQYLDQDKINAVSGSCICCSGINELRETVNSIPIRKNGITLIEANGTTDAVSLMGFLGLGMKEHFLPPVQVGVVDVRYWQKRAEYNDLELNQIMASSIILLNFENEVTSERLESVEKELRLVNKKAKIIKWCDLSLKDLSGISPVQAEKSEMDHKKSHWASCSVELPDPMKYSHLETVLNHIPEHILRIKGVTRLDSDKDYSYFEKTPNGKVYKRPYRGNLNIGAKILTIGPGSDPDLLKSIIMKSESNDHKVI